MADSVTASRAAELAGTSYRQLDHWVRRGWVSPSVDAGLGRHGRRLFAPDDVVRLAALAHLGAAGANLAAVAPRLAALDLAADRLVVLEPATGEVEAVPAAQLRARVSRAPGRTVVVFDPSPVRAGLAEPATDAPLGGRADAPLAERRTA